MREKCVFDDLYQRIKPGTYEGSMNDEERCFMNDQYAQSWSTTELPENNSPGMSLRIESSSRPAGVFRVKDRRALVGPCRNNLYLDLS